MPDQPVVIQKISWADLCPWTIIFKTLPIASSFTVLALALVGTVVTPVGWWLSEQAFVNDALRENVAFMEMVERNNSPFGGVFRDLPGRDSSAEFLGIRVSGPRDVFRQFVSPYQNLFDRRYGLREFGYFLFGIGWTLALWGFVGLAIARVSLVRLTRNEFVGLDDAFDFSKRNWTTVVGAIGAPLAAVGALCVPAFLLGLLMTFDLGAMLVGFLWVLVLLLSAAIAVLLLGLMFGWPLMVASVGCESQNSFDAMTRSYAYTFQRPLNYLFYALVSILFGGLCWMVVSALADGVVGLTYWTTSWGANVAAADRMDLIAAGPPLTPDDESATSSLSIGRSAIGFWNGVIRSLAAGFLYGLFWCLASAVYLLLRKDVDETEMDEILIDEEQRSYQLPPLQSDSLGIPQVKTMEDEAEETIEHLGQPNPPDDQG